MLGWPASQLLSHDSVVEMKKKYHIRNESPVQVDTGCLGLVHWDDLEGWYREGGGRGVQDGEHECACGRFMLMCGRTNTIL